MNIKSERQFPGFTLIEIIVVLFIVSIGIVGVMSLIVQNIQSQSYDKNSLISAQLAQEGIELVRMVRDSNWKKNIAFYSGLATNDGTPYRYYMDYHDDFPQQYTGNSAELVLKQDSSGFYHDYNYSSGRDSNFSRLITITKFFDYYLRVDSTVTWTEHNRQHSYQLETRLYNWK